MEPPSTESAHQTSKQNSSCGMKCRECSQAPSSCYRCCVGIPVITPIFTGMYISHDKTVQYSTLQYSTLEYNATRFNTILHKAIQYSTIRCDTRQHRTTHHNTRQYTTIQHKARQDNTTQDKTIQESITQYNTRQYNKIRMQCSTVHYSSTHRKQHNTRYYMTLPNIT